MMTRGWVGRRTSKKWKSSAWRDIFPAHASDLRDERESDDMPNTSLTSLSLKRKKNCPCLNRKEKLMEKLRRERISLSLLKNPTKLRPLFTCSHASFYPPQWPPQSCCHGAPQYGSTETRGSFFSPYFSFLLATLSLYIVFFFLQPSLPLLIFLFYFFEGVLFLLPHVQCKPLALVFHLLQHRRSIFLGLYHHSFYCDCLQL